MKNTKLNTILWALIFGFFWATPAHAQIVDAKTKPGEIEVKEEGDYDLTDQARFESQVYIHEGLSQRKMDEECAKLKDPNACLGRGKTKFMGIDSTIIQTVAKAYSIVGGMSGGVLDFETRGDSGTSGAADNTAGTDPNNTDGANADSGQEGDGGTKKNYCTMIPAAGETVAMFMQQTAQNTLQQQPTTQETPQKELLYRAARSHDARADSAKVQGATWGATTACYGYYMAAGGIVIDTKVILQAAAAGFLTAFWLNEAKQQEDYANEIKKIADNLPGRGDCNPHTQLDCYCTQPETQYDPVHCVPQLHKKAVATNSFRVPCVDKDLKADAQCDCITTEACFDQEYFSELKAPGFVQFAQSSAGKDFRNLTRGELSNGRLNAGANGNSARSKKLLGDLASKVDENPSLSGGDVKVSDEFERMGVPKPLARLMASQRTTPQANRRVAGLSADLNKSRDRFKKAKTRGGSSVLRFNRATGKVGPRSKKSGNNFNAMMKKFKKKGGNRNSNKVMRFAQKAEKQAQITRDKGRPLFEIISRRYQVSGWKRLEIQ